jgi:arylsulfatase
VAAGAAVASSLPAAPAKKPNIVIFLADDMGYSDARCFGGDIDTPNLDRLASTGLRFTQCYNTARCGPSRSSLLTGRYAQETSADVMTPGNIPDYVRYIPEYLKPLGYRSYHSGKWHMRVTMNDGAGFDRSYALMDEDRYFTPRNLLLDGQPLPQPRLEDHYYTTSAIADYGVKFLAEHALDHASSPFFLYLSPHSPHFPLQALPEDIEKYKDRFAEGWDTAREVKLARMKRMGLVNCGLPPLEPNMWTNWNTPDAELFAKIGPGEVTRAVPWSTLTPVQKEFQRAKMAVHAAMITRMDLEFGKVLRQVQAMGAERDTVVIFLSDNGASSEQMIRGDGHDATAPIGSAGSFLGLGPGWASNSNAPLRLHKSWVNEGGVSSPMIVNWPNGIADQNKLRHNPCHFVDMLPTIVNLAGGNADTVLSPAPGAPPITGRTLVPAFKKDGAAPHPYIYFNHNHNRALRVGDWKVIATGDDGPWEVYNLGTDRSEMHNLMATNSAKGQQLAAQWKEIDDAFTKERNSGPRSTKPLQAAGEGGRGGSGGSAGAPVNLPGK